MKADLKVVKPAPVEKVLVASVTSNGKGGVNCQLGRLTLLIGRNGSGKSSVVQAVEAALTGAVSQLNGRPLVKDPATIATMGVNGCYEAGVHLSDGSLASYTVGAAKGAKKPKWVIPPTVDANKVLPLRAVREALTGSEEAAHRFFLQQTCGELDAAVDIFSRLPLPLHGPFKRVFNPSTADVVSELLGSVDKIKQIKKVESDRGKAAEDIVTRTGSGLPPEPTEMQVTSARERLERAKIVYAAVAAGSAEEVQQLKSKLDAIETRASTLKQYLDTLPASPGPEITAVQMLLDWSVERAVDFCLCCGTRDMAGAFVQRQQALAVALAGIARAQTDRNPVESELAQVRGQWSSTQALLEFTEARLGKGREALGSELLPSLDGAKLAVDQAEQVVADLQSNGASWTSLRTSKGIAAEAGQRSDEWKRLGKEVDKLIKELLVASVDRFVTKVQRYCRQGDIFFLSMEDGFAFGLVKDGRRLTALSDGEWVRVTAAMAAAVSEGSPLSVLIPEDRQFDSYTLAEVMTALTRYEGQVLIHSTHLPIGPCPAEWVIIDTDRGKHRVDHHD